MSMITAATWIPRGIPARHPTRYTVDDAEIARISELAQAQLDDAREGLAKARKGRNDDDDDDMNDDNEDAGVPVPVQSTEKDIADDLAEYQLDDYDNEATNPADGSTEGVARLNILGNVRSLAYHAPGDEDPYVTLPANDDSDADEREELEVLPMDNMLVTARVADEVAQLEVYVYEDAADNLYVHHDVMLPAIPLCVERLEGPVGGTLAQTANGEAGAKSAGRNYVAVGTFDPDIEIWDLDTVDGMYPAAILGAATAPTGTEEPSANGTAAAPKKKKKKKKRSKKANAHYHVAAVLALAANPNHRTLLASASADATVKLWDLNTTTCAHSYDLHTDKACALDWHPRDTSVLLSGGYDQRVVVADMRAPAGARPTWTVDSDVDAVRWDPHSPEKFFATTDAGSVYCFDSRAAPSSASASSPLWTLRAHDKSLSAFDVNAHVPGFLATGSTDKSVKLWRVGAEGPAMVTSRETKLGKVFAARFAPDEATAFRLAVAGSKGAVQVWDTSTNAAVRRAFAERGLREDGGGEGRERLVGVADDSESDDSEGEDTGEGAMEED